MEKIPLVISGLAFLVSVGQLAFTWKQTTHAEQQLAQAQKQLDDARAQFKTSLKPLVGFDIEDDPDNFPFGIAIENRGTGPAVIKSVTYYVNRVPFTNIEDAVAAGHLKSSETNYIELEAEDGLGAGQKEWLLYRPKKFSSDKAEAKRFADFLDNNFAIEISFCSLADECSKRCSTPGWCS